MKINWFHYNEFKLISNKSIQENMMENTRSLKSIHLSLSQTILKIVISYREGWQVYRKIFQRIVSLDDLLKALVQISN